MKLKTASAAILLGVIGVLQTGVACACSCPPASPTGAMERYSNADAIFTGWVIDYEPEDDQYLLWTFSVESTEKGEVPDPVTVRSHRSSATCGFNFEMGRRYRVFARYNDQGRLGTGLCTGTALAENGSTPPPVVRPSESPPASVPSPVVSPSPSASPSPSPVANSTPSAPPTSEAAKPEVTASPASPAALLSDTSSKPPGNRTTAWLAASAILLTGSAIGWRWKRTRGS